MRTALLALSLLFPHTAVADPDRLSFLLGSYHASPAQEFEEFNPGVFLTWEGQVDTTVGLFRNSYGRAALSATADWTLYERDRFAFSVFAGAAYYPGDGDRFRIHLGDLIPLAGLQARFGPTFVQLLPSDGAQTDGVLTFGVTFPLN